MFRTTFAALFAMLIFLAPAAASGFYVTGFGGANQHDPFGGEGDKASFWLDPDVGYAAGVALGRHLAFLPGLRAEIEASWRTNSLDGLFEACQDTVLSGHDGTFATLINLVYEREIHDFRPYLLAGAGYNARRISIDPTPENFAANGFGTERQGVAWQVGAGVDYELSDGVRAGIGYRYFSGTAINRRVVVDGAETYMIANGDSHAALLSLTFAID